MFGQDFSLENLSPDSAGTTVLDSGLGKWTLEDMERFHRGAFVSLLLQLMAHYHCVIGTDCPVNYF